MSMLTLRTQPRFRWWAGALVVRVWWSHMYRPYPDVPSRKGRPACSVYIHAVEVIAAVDSRAWGYVHDLGIAATVDNVLLPNSDDGWWIYKYYNKQTPRVHTCWTHRQKLLAQQILSAGSDVVCLQECAPASFDSDFAFMAEAGFAHALLNKGRMRCATFWAKRRFELLDSKCKDRTLITRLRDIPSGRTLCVLNCHLSAGPHNGPRRLRQVFDGLEVIRKMIAKAKNHPAQDAVVVCGDFNSAGSTGVRELLVEGAVSPDFREVERPDEAVTSKRKSTTIGPFRDALEDAFGGAPPPTMVVSQLEPHMVNQKLGGGMSHKLIQQVRRMFERFAQAGAMDRAAVEKWLVAINGEVGRGSEFRSAEAILEARRAETNGKEELHADDLVSIYRSELEEGKFWGVESDLVAVLGEGMAVEGQDPFMARYDYIYHSAAMVCRCVPAAPPNQSVLPNSSHPSDHLPVVGVFDWK